MALGAGQAIFKNGLSCVALRSFCVRDALLSMEGLLVGYSAHPWSVGYAFTIKHTELILSFQSIETSTSKLKKELILHKLVNFISYSR